MSDNKQSLYDVIRTKLSVHARYKINLSNIVVVAPEIFHWNMSASVWWCTVAPLVKVHQKLLRQKPCMREPALEFNPFASAWLYFYRKLINNNNIF